VGIVGGVDRFQRRHGVLGLPLAVVYKFFDDQGNYLAAMLTYYAFVAIFPLLLLSVSVLGFLLQDNPGLEQQVLDSALAQFPVIGDDLGTPEGLSGSFTTIVVSTVIALYGSIGLGSAIQNALNVAWSVPRNSRPNPVLLRLKSLLLLLAAGIAVLGVTAVAIIAQATDFLGDLGALGTWLVTGVSTLVITAGMTLVFRLAAARTHPWVYALPGAFFVALMWQVLQVASTAFVNRVVTQTSSVNQTFGVVLGLIGLIFIASMIAIFGIELNVVVTRRLWPRALLTPFTDSVDLTEADRRAYASYAMAQRHKGFEQVNVDFGVPPHRDEDEPEPAPEQPSARTPDQT
jgi:membrane protein